MAIQLGGRKSITFRKGKKDSAKAERVRIYYREPETDVVTTYLAKAMGIRKKQALDTPDGMKAAFDLRMEAALEVFDGAEGFEADGIEVKEALRRYGSEYMVRLAQFVFEGVGDAEIDAEEELGKSDGSPSSTAAEASAS